MPAITEHLLIPDRELFFSFSRSRGPGGQNVNKVSTKVTLIFDVANSPTLSNEEKQRILDHLVTRINKAGQLRVVSFRHRTQGANRDAALLRFVALLQGALQEAKPRKKTSMPKAARQRRLAAKKHRSRLKRTRSGQGEFLE